MNGEWAQLDRSIMLGDERQIPARPNVVWEAMLVFIEFVGHQTYRKIVRLLWKFREKFEGNSRVKFYTK